MDCRKNVDDNGGDGDGNKEGVGAVPPLLCVIQQLSPIETDHLVKMFMSFVMENSEMLVGMASLWIYALFMRLEAPYRSATVANMRNFARFCVKQRNQSKNALPVANILIVIIEDVFKQPVT